MQPLHRFPTMWRVTPLGLTLLATPPRAYAADPTTTDCLTASENAIKERNEHRLRSARSELLVCAAASCPEDVRNECARRVAEVNAAMPTIVFEAKDALGNDVSSVQVTMDGQLLIERLAGAAISIDPGEHSFTFETAGQPSITKRFILVEGAKDRRERIAFGAAPAASPAAAGGPDEPGAQSAARVVVANGAPTVPDPGPKADPWRTIGWVAAGAGVVGLGLGVVFEMQRSSKLSQREEVCPSHEGCPVGSQAEIDALTKDARALQTRAGVALIAGGVSAAGGLALIFLAPRASGTKVSVTPALSAAFQGVKVSGHVW